MKITPTWYSSGRDLFPYATFLFAKPSLYCLSVQTNRFLTGLLLALFLALPLHATAATSTDPVSDPVLRGYYLQQLQETKPNPALDDLISKQRARLRADEAKTLDALVSSANIKDEENAQTPQTALLEQQALVDKIEARQQETKVDLGVLGEEEAALEQNMQEGPDNLIGVLRRKAELLSRRAVLEERLAAVGDVLTQQQDRLERFQAQDRREKLASAAQVLFYVGIFILIIVAERLVRLRVLTRIRDRNRRYFAMKMFAGVVYVVLIVWALYRLSSDYPGIVTSFAIIGAGIAVALQSVIKDVVGWIVIMQKRLFRLGQRVTIGPYTGDIADISVLRTAIVEVHNTNNEDSGRIGQLLYLPNSMILDQPVMNFHATSDFMEAEMPIVAAPLRDLYPIDRSIGSRVGDVEDTGFLAEAFRGADAVF